MLVGMSPRAPYTRRAFKIIKIMSFEGSRESPPGVTIPFIGSLVMLPSDSLGRERRERQRGGRERRLERRRGGRGKGKERRRKNAAERGERLPYKHILLYNHVILHNV